MKPRGEQGRIAGLLAGLLIVATGCGGSSAADSDITSGDGGNTGGTTISDLSQSPAELGVGDLMIFDVSAAGKDVSFAGVSEGSQFILAVGSGSSSGAGSSIQLASASIAAEVADVPFKGMGTDELENAALDEDAAYGPNEMMSAWLRASEEGLNDVETPAIPAASGKFMASASKAMGLGGSETFRVLASLSNVQNTVDVTGTVKCVGSQVVFYLDDSVGPEKISDVEIQELCNTFDAEAVDEIAMLGAISDVDGDGKLHVLMTKQINKLGALGGGVITGYFYAGDLYERSESNPASNHREIIYTLVPDEAGEYGIAIQKSFALANLLPAVLPHELQHAISYNQHVLVGGGQPEENWLNEGLSHLMEDVMGHNLENPSRYALYLASPSTYGIVTQSSPNLMERGGAYLFLRFLYEQASDGSAFLRSIVQSEKRGVENLEAAFSGPQDMSRFPDFMRRWIAALAMTDRGISSDPRFTYQARVKNASTGSWQGVCLSCDAEDGRGTILTGVNLNTYHGYHTVSLDGATAKFYSLSTLPNTLNLTGASDGSSFGVLVRTE